jgi:Icc-related predicted phosphoesterase
MQKRAFMEAYNTSMRVVRFLRKKAPVYTIYGNVESTNAETTAHAKEIGLPLPFLTTDLKNAGVRVVNDRLFRIRSLRVGGLRFFVDTNWVQDFKPANYRARMAAAKRETERAKRLLTRFGKTDILLCHHPPYGILDKVTSPHAPAHWRGKHAGSKAILAYIKRQQPTYVFCGHIHEGEGKRRVGKTTIYNLGVGGHVVVEMT